MKNYNLKLTDINPKLAKEVKEIRRRFRTEKGKVELERSKKANDLFKQGNTSDMFKVMFGQDK